MTNDQSKRMRWRPRWSVRTLLILVLLLGSGLGWVGDQVRQSRSHNRALAELQNLNAHLTVTYSYEADRYGVPTTRDEPPRGPSWLHAMLGEHCFVDNTRVWLRGDQVSNSDLAHLQRLTNLRRLLLYSAQVNDDGMIHLGECRKLEFLYIGADITDAGLEHLRGLKALKDLHLVGCRIGRHSDMRDGLGGSPVDVEEYDTAVTVAGVRRLQRSLPNCRIVF